MIDFDALLTPVAGEEPCGPDLELLGDGEFLEFFARIDGVLPRRFFSRDSDGRPVPFDRSSIVYHSEYTALFDLLARTRDVRLLVVAARLAILEQDLHGFSEIFRVLSLWLERWWDAVNPVDADASPSIRLETLRTLDDLPTIIIPLQHVPLVVDARLGRINFRHFMIATGQAPSSGDIPSIELQGLEDAVRRADAAGIALNLARLQVLRTAIASIQQTCASRAARHASIRFDHLLGLIDEIVRGIAKASPTLVRATGGPDQAVADPSPPLDSAEQPALSFGQAAIGARAPSTPDGVEDLLSRDSAGQLLSRVIEYFETHEPSSPVLLLVLQARRLIGVSFAEALEALAPGAAGQARFRFDREGDEVFELSVSRLILAASSSTAPVAGFAHSADLVGQEPVSSRDEAVWALRSVASFFRKAEPSSPVPLIVDKACELAGRDFISLLKSAIKG